MNFENDEGVNLSARRKGRPRRDCNMPEDVRKKTSDAVVSQAAGIGGKYSWMTAGNENSYAFDEHWRELGACLCPKEN
jgi:hypothetical protein